MKGIRKPKTSTARAIHNELRYWDWDYINSLTDEVTCPYYLSEREVAALLTFMDTMGWKTRWVSPTAQTVDLDFIEGLRDGISDKLMREDDCPSDPCEDGCIEYLPNATFIRYEPNDPFRTPLIVPDGYTIIPWYTNPLIPLPGVLATDTMVNQLSVLAPALPLSGFPRFSFEFDGRGEVEIELVNVPAGGFCLVVLDENPLNVKIVNTSSNILDIISLAGILAALGIDSENANVVDTDIVEIDVEDIGHHRIDVTFLPNFGGETLLGFGGGLRRITFCGVMTVVEEMYLQRQSPEDNCLIEQSTDGGITWQEAWRMDNCCGDETPLQVRYSSTGEYETSPDGEAWTTTPELDPRESAPQAPPLGGTGDLTKCASANNVADLFEGYRDTLIDLLEASTPLLAIVAGIVGFIGAILGVSGLATGLGVLMIGFAAALITMTPESVAEQIDEDALYIFRCILFCHADENGQYSYAAWQAILSDIAAQFDDFPELFFYQTVAGMGRIGLSNAGSAGAATADNCDGCYCSEDDEWWYEFDFTENAHSSYFAIQSSQGSYVAGQGYAPSNISGAYRVRVMGTFDPDLTLRGYIVAMNNGGVANFNRSVLHNATFDNYDGNTSAIIVNTERWATPATISNIGTFWAGAVNGTSQAMRVTRIVLHGTGVSPFGSDNYVFDALDP